MSKHKFVRSGAWVILHLLLLCLLVAVGMIVCDERLSRQLDNVDITWEELERGRIKCSGLDYLSDYGLAQWLQ